MSDLFSIQQEILAFRDAREWQQYHDPENLSEALSIEAFLWKTAEQSRNLTTRQFTNAKQAMRIVEVGPGVTV